MSDEFDLIVIGAGPAGENAAGVAAAGGLTAAIVESERVGGECSYWACIPSKALLRPVEQMDVARHTPGVQQAVRGEISTPDVLRHRDASVHQYDDAGQADWLRHARVTLFRGQGRLAGPRQVTVRNAAGNERQLAARKAVVIATGSRAFIPPVPGLAEARPWTNREATGAKAAPRRLLVYGGGVVGVELSQAWRSLGSAEVTLVSREGLLKRNEPFVGEMIATALRGSGVDVRLRTELKQVRRTGAEVVATLDSGEKIAADEILVATGRVPATHDLGLETIGLQPGQFVKVDDSLRATGVPEGWLYACGDANGRNLLTHMGKYQGRLIGEAVLGKSVSAWADERATPQVIFTEPQVAACGLTEAAARKRGLRVRSVQVALEDVAGTSLMGPYWKGVAQIVVDEDRHVLVGSTLVGTGVGEMIHAATVAIAGEVPLDRLWHAVPSFPSVSEIWLALMQKYGM